VAYGLKLRKIPKEEIRERVKCALHDVRLPGKEYMHPGELSSGEAQRLALARAFAIDPDILFLDEPTASLDPENTRIIEDIIAEWRSKSDKIVALVTHSLAQAKVLSDRVIFMQKGRIEEFSDTALFFNRPSTQLAQKFVI
jgi:tungstate transport system ATP-binding protein